ncbi:MAG: RoPhREQ1 [Streptosporangiaceae bacterium]|nr:RoPhREQ1 [Streptosporangiaceae bacterium]
MPYPIEFLDYAGIYTDFTQANNTGQPLTVGSNGTYGDLRVCVVMAYFNNNSGTGTFSTWTWSTPTGWAIKYDNVVNDSAADTSMRLTIFTMPLTPTSVDSPGPTPTFVGSFGFAYASSAQFTVRNVLLSQSFSPSRAQGIDTSSTTLTPTAPSISVPANGTEVAIWFLGGTYDITTPPGGMTRIGEDSEAFTNGVFAQTFTTAGSSGSKSITLTGTAPAYGVIAFALTQNPDVAVTIGTATSNEVDTAGVVTPALQNLVSFQIGTAVAEQDTANQVATPLTGFRISPPLALPQSPITNSVIHWDQTTLGAGSTVTVETSVDNGVSWQVADNDAPIPRLLYGYNTATTVISRVTLYRANITDPTPRVANLEVRVATDSSQNELVSLGVFYITSTDILVSGGTGSGSASGGGGGTGVTGSGGGATGGGLTIQLSGVDQSRQVSRNTWQDVYYIPANTNYATAIQQIIDNRLPNLQFNFQSTPLVTPKIVLGTQLGNDPWQDAQDMATAIGFELFFDAAGVCTLREVPDPATGQSVWTFTDAANPTIATLDRTLTDQTTFNYVIVYGESVNNAVPVQAIAFDNDPNSPTYYLGPYGIVSTTFQSAMITTTAQAQAAANALLLAVKGASENVALTVVPNPALEPGDVVTVNVADAQVSGTFLINDIQTPLSAAMGQTLTVYRQSS